MTTIKEKAQELYPVEQKANEYTAFIEGAEFGNRQAIQFVTDLLVSAFEKGFLSEEQGNEKRNQQLNIKQYETF